MDWIAILPNIDVVIATILGPIFAVQAQKWLEVRREKENRRVAIFRILMATRRSVLSQQHVEALNIVPIEFYGNRLPFVSIVNAWKTYIDHLYKLPNETQAWEDKRVDLLNDTLVKMSSALGYHFNLVEISRELYSPQGHVAIQSDQDVIRRGLVALLKGETSLPMDVRSFPTDPSIVKTQAEIQTSLLSWLTGNGSVKINLGETRYPDMDGNP